ncbi:hypothetical protein Cni_G04522 [Canna indica]|uniref:Uncharacterized protein n=1 Tax=Canna indica TaxID=4628 RepID=A0AAQ3Q421_9LILI|nr:hypothetical protein Cni_G04522 [Canna indica]
MARCRKRRRHCQVLNALQRAYGGPVRTLEVTIVSLLPPPPSSPAQCSCSGRGCLGCGSSAYLLRKDDPIDYRVLLTWAFCVVSRDAPPPPKLFTGDIPHTLYGYPTVPSVPMVARARQYRLLFGWSAKKKHYDIRDLDQNSVCFTVYPNKQALPKNKQKRKRDSINERSNMGSAAVPGPNTSFMIVSSESESLVSKANKKQRISKDPKRAIDRKKDLKLDGEELNMRILSEDRFQNTSLNDRLAPDSVLKPHYEETPLLKLKYPCTKDQYSNGGSLRMDYCSNSSGDCLSKKLRKHGRPFRWQRQRKKKARKENISGGRDMEISKMEFLDFDCNSCLPLQLSGTITSSASTEVGITNDSIFY